MASTTLVVPSSCLRINLSMNAPSRSARQSIMESGSLVEKILSLPIDELLKSSFNQRVGKSLAAKLDKCQHPEEGTAKAVALTTKALSAANEQRPWLFTQYQNPLIAEFQTHNPQCLRNRALDALHNGKTLEQKLRQYDGNPKKKEKLEKLLGALYESINNATISSHSLSNMVVTKGIPRLMRGFCLEAGMEVEELMKAEYVPNSLNEHTLMEQYKTAFVEDKYVNICSGLFHRWAAL